MFPEFLVSGLGRYGHYHQQAVMCLACNVAYVICNLCARTGGGYSGHWQATPSHSPSLVQISLAK